MEGEDKMKPGSITETGSNSKAILKPKAPTDMFGKTIDVCDSYFMVGNQLIHIDSMEDYFIEVLGATVHERKKADYSAK